MAIQGLNITIQIQRRVAGPDDEVGGATNSFLTIGTGIRARISSVKPSEDLRIQGIESSKIYNMVIQPATTDIIETDIIIPESGNHEGKTFRVTGVQVSSVNSASSRSHLSVRLRREEFHRTLQ